MFDTDATIFPRVDIAQSGLAPLTSMFFFGPNDHGDFDDWRAAVHDTDGLALRTGNDERIWRPLINPHKLQISAFSDVSPRGFGLLQRARKFTDYQDLEADYQKRPSLWVEPIGDWGQGVVELVEIPSKKEVNDNIVAFWRPHDPLKAKTAFKIGYRLHWCWTAPEPGPVRACGADPQRPVVRRQQPAVRHRLRRRAAGRVDSPRRRRRWMWVPTRARS